MASPKEFARRMRELAAQIKTGTEAAWKASALAVDQAVVTSTPVDTGRARANWRVQVDAPIVSAPLPAPPNAGQAAQQAINQGQAAIASARGQSTEIYISNNVEYIGQLNDGSSAQAPAGFVELAVEAGLRRVKQIRLLKG